MAREGLYPSSRIYVNSEYYWHFSIREEQSNLARAAIGRSKRHSFGTRFYFIRLNQMAKLETSIFGLTVRRSMVQHIVGQAGVALVYLGIVATFASVTFIAWLISLVIW
jgi:hypothetical protein